MRCEITYIVPLYLTERDTCRILNSLSRFNRYNMHYLENLKDDFRTFSLLEIKVKGEEESSVSMYRGSERIGKYGINTTIVMVLLSHVKRYLRSVTFKHYRQGYVIKRVTTNNETKKLMLIDSSGTVIPFEVTEVGVKHLCYAIKKELLQS